MMPEPMPETTFPMTLSHSAFPVPEPMPAPTGSPGVPQTTSGPCGCGWSTQHGCRVSGIQLTTALTHQMLLPACHDGRASGKLCAVLRQLRSESSALSRCLDLGPRLCSVAPECQWGAQSQGQCGIDEEQLVLRLVGTENRHNPLVKMIMLHDHCSKHGEEWCDADPACAWGKAWPRDRCDVKPAIMIHMALSSPRMMGTLEQMSQEAKCLAGSVRTGNATCSRPCRMVHGLCRLEPRFAQFRSLKHTVDVLCMRSMEAGKGCPTPCQSQRVVFRGGARITCKAPAHLRPPNHPQLRMVTVNRHLVDVMTLLMGLTEPFAEQCVAQDEATCHASTPVCTQAVEAGGGMPLPPPTLVPGAPAGGHGPGVKGILQAFAHAIAEGRAGEVLEDYFENNPTAVGNITGKALGGFSALLKPSTSRSAPLPAPLEEEWEEEEEEGEGYDDFDPSDVRRHRHHRGDTAAWAAACGGAALLAAVCAGIAFGALCHARMARTQAREPLLAGGGGLADRELEPASAPPASA